MTEYGRMANKIKQLEEDQVKLQDKIQILSLDLKMAVAQLEHLASKIPKVRDSCDSLIKIFKATLKEHIK